MVKEVLRINEDLLLSLAEHIVLPLTILSSPIESTSFNYSCVLLPMKFSEH